jgi:GT2 family glycosyltransferase
MIGAGEVGLTLTTIIPRYLTDQKLLAKALNNLRQGSEGECDEIIVVDSSPEPVTRVDLSGVRYLHFPERLRVGAARNLGIKEAQGEWISFLDSDCIRVAGWRQRLFENIFRTPNARVFTGPVLLEERAEPWELAFHLWEFQEFQGARRHISRFAVGCNSVFHSSVFKEVGYFEPEWQNIEDFEFGFRAAEQFSISFVPELSVVHSKGVLKRGELMRKAENMGYWRAYHDKDLHLKAQLFRRWYAPLISRFPRVAALLSIFINLVLVDSYYRHRLISLVPDLCEVCESWAKGFKRGLSIDSVS